SAMNIADLLRNGVAGLEILAVARAQLCGQQMTDATELNPFDAWRRLERPGRPRARRARHEIRPDRQRVSGAEGVGGDRAGLIEPHPDTRDDAAGEADEPCVFEIVGGARLAAGGEAYAER